MGFFIIMPRVVGVGAGGLRSATKIVAASNSLDKSRADYVCDGTADQEEINTAIAALGAAGGVVLLLEGAYSITGSINLASNVALVGQGPGTVLRIPDGFNADLNVIYGSSVSGVLVENLRIDGNKANQGAGSMNGIYLSSATYSEVRGCWVENMTNHGICLFYYSNTNTVAGNTCRGNGNCGIYLYASSNNVVAANSCRGNGYGIYFDHSDNNVVVANSCRGNSSHGIFFFTGGNSTIAGNSCWENGNGISLRYAGSNIVSGNSCHGNGNGIYLYDSDNNTFSGNSCCGNSSHGIHLHSSCGYNTFSGNSCCGNGSHGIYLESSCNNNIFAGNSVLGNSKSSDNSYDGIHAYWFCHYNLISGNIVRHQDSQRYGINISHSNSNGNLVHGNDLYQAGKTADFNDAGTGTIYHNNRTSAGWVP